MTIPLSTRLLTETNYAEQSMQVPYGSAEQLNLIKIRKVRFPNLNGLRFLAAFGVVIHHIEQVKSLHGLPNLYSMPLVSRLGGLSVSLFFVLSGFLITFLLKEEITSFGSIDIKKFYIRRALRIWPLYFMLCFLGFIVLPAFPIYNVPTFGLTWSKTVWKAAFLYCIFSPHVAMAIGVGAQYASVLWSVGVEEWFYLLWPLVMKYVQRFLPVVLLTIIFALVIGRTQFPINTSSLGNFLYFLRFDCMSIGGLFALLFCRRDLRISRYLLSILYRTDFQLFIYVFLAVSMIQGLTFGVLGGPGEIIYSSLFAIVILNLATNKRSILELEWPIMKWLGEISYGLYCYNWITIMSSLLLLKYLLPFLRPHVLSWAIFVLAIPLTVAVAAISYEFMERRFLLLKQRFFTRVPTSTMSDLPVEAGQPSAP